MIYIRYCKRCKKPFDQNIDYEICPECRGEVENDKEN